MAGRTPFHIREARLPQDKAAILSFIIGLQCFEKLIEPNRRMDCAVAEEFYAAIITRVSEHHGRIFIAEDDNAQPIGWAVSFEQEKDIYVIAEERTFGYISELYVAEAARGWGIGHALIAACEDWAKARGLRVMMIGALEGNRQAFDVYRKQGYAPYSTDLRKYLR